MSQWYVKPLLALHDRARGAPYYDLPGYMLRDWVLGYRSPERNGDNPAWKAGFSPKSSALYRGICRNIAIRAHTILRSDADRHLHDHPSWSLSVVLEGGYWEVLEPTPYALQRQRIYERLLDCLTTETPDADLCARYGIIWRGPGAIVLRRATDFHRLILPKGSIAKSIFVMGKKSNSWGFLTSNGKVYWRTYLGLDEEKA